MTTILMKRAELKADLPTLAEGEIGFCLDTKELYIGDGTTNHLIGPAVRGITFNLGLATVGTKLAQALIPGTFNIPKVIAYGDTAPIGADLKINIKINGSSLWDDADRLIIANGANSGSNSDLDHRDLGEGNRLSIDIDQVGSTTPGGDDLLVTIIC
ncbi:hypothetical protein ES702_01722 [subsurface metagenome]